jgi:GTPase SAR1 family protein
MLLLFLRTNECLYVTSHVTCVLVVFWHDFFYSSSHVVIPLHTTVSHNNTVKMDGPVEVKICIIGDSDAGKTSLSMR